MLQDFNLQNKVTDKAALAGFVIIGIFVVAGLVTDSVFLIAGALILALLAGMFLAYPPRMAAMLFGIQIVFTTSFLNGFTAYVGPFNIGVDDLLQLWIFFLWFGAFIDGNGRTPRTKSGKLILVLIAMCFLAFFRGILAGYDLETSAHFLKIMLGYLFFFPAMWILKDRKNMKILIVTFLVSSVIAALWIILKGYLGGDGVYIRDTSGLRVSSQEANVVMVSLFLVAMLLWKKHKSISLFSGITILLTMGAAILLGQSRALWLAVAAGVLIAFVADMSRAEEGGFKISRLISRILLLLIFVGGSIAFVAATGLLSAGDVVARGGGADGGFTGDVSLWARYLSWWEILRVVTKSPFTLIFGAGFGADITYFRPDLVARVSIPYVDGSFFQMLLNTGLSGSITLALLYANGISGSFRSAIKSYNQRDVVLSLWLSASFTALTIAALSASLITNYRFNCLWAFMFALLETIRRRSEFANQ